jgi:hypothetical protein
VKQYQADPFPGEKLPPALPTEILLDRYHSHTEKCASCRQALTRIQQVRKVVGVIGAIAWLILPIIGILIHQSTPFVLGFGATFTLLCGAIWLALKSLELRFYQGRAIPPRNLS